MGRFKIYFFPILLFFIYVNDLAAAQTKDSLDTSVRVLTLQEVIELALRQSPEYYYSVNLKENKYWKWKSFRSNYMPQVSLTGTLPDFKRSYIPVTQQDGTIEFRSISNAISDLRLNLSQSIGFTGGYIFASSQLTRFDNFRTNKYEYSGNPAMIGFNQPIFGFNQFLWDKRIEPLKYEESQKEYTEKLEEISLTATEHFFNLMLAQISLEMANKNRANSDTIFKIAQTKFELGRIAENELMQVELSLMSAQQAVARSQLDLETSALKLKIFIGITDGEPVQLVLPDAIPQFEIDENIAIAEAKKNRSAVIRFKRNLLEAERDIAIARSNRGLKANLLVTYGLTNKAAEIRPIYNDPMDQQSLRIGFEIPIVDWGRSKAIMKTAIANQKLVKNTVQQEELNFDQQVNTVVKQVQMLNFQTMSTKKSDILAQKRYEVSKNKYIVGKIGMTDLNIALQEKDQAKFNYIESLRDYWTLYYNLRMLTLYDFQNKSTITHD